MDSCSASPARSCCSWAASSASGPNGTTTRAWNGTCSTRPLHAGLQRWVRDLNTFYRGQPALHEIDCAAAGFQWVDCTDSQQSVVSFLRLGKTPGDMVLFVCNFTPVPRHNYRVGVPAGGFWRELLNSDATLYGGSGQGNITGVEAAPLPMHGRPYSLNLTLPPLAAIVLRPDSAETAQ